jgi:DNA-directed RNA polymerase subunit L
MADPMENHEIIFTNMRKHPNKATGRIQFHIRHIDLSVVNGLRRTILTDIPTVGLVFEDNPTVVVKTNTGPLHNEILIHRMSMLPLHLTEAEVEAYEPRSISFKISKHNTTTSIQNLSTNDMELMRDNVVLPLSEVNRLFPANDWSKKHILITRLRAGEIIEMSGEFVKSTARVNAGFCPVSLCSFTPEMDTERIRQDGITDVLERERTFLKNDYGDPIAWLFELEPENGMTVAYLVAKAFEIMIKKIELARKTLSTDDLEVLALEAAGTYEYVFKDEDDTLGNLIQAYIHNTYYRTERLVQHRFRVSYVGYMCPHPLETKMHVRLTLRPPKEENTDLTEDSITELTVRDFFKQALDELKTHLGNYYQQWCRFTGRDCASIEEPETEAEADAEGVKPEAPPKLGIPEPAVEPAIEPVGEPVGKPVGEPVGKPVGEPVAPPKKKPAPRKKVVPKEKPEAEAKAKPEAEAKAEPKKKSS